MKKILAFVLVVSLLAVAGSAFAYGRGNARMMGGQCGQCDGGNSQMSGRGGFGGRGGQMMGGGRGGFGGRGGMMGGEFGGRGYGRNGNAQIQAPDEVKAKFAEVQKMGIDLRTELQKRPVDKAKVLEIHKKMTSLHNEISTWRFSQYLNSLK